MIDLSKTSDRKNKMIKKIEKITWEVNGITFNTEKEAIQHQQNLEKEKIESKYLPNSHKKDTKFIYHCVNCGEKLVEYEEECDGIDRIRTGKKIFEIKFFTVFKGKRCEKCYEILKNKVIGMLVRQEIERNKFPKWEDQEHANNDVKSLEKEYRKLLYSKSQMSSRANASCSNDISK
jgi:hypothetical protein